MNMLFKLYKAKSHTRLAFTSIGILGHLGVILQSGQSFIQPLERLGHRWGWFGNEGVDSV